VERTGVEGERKGVDNGRLVRVDGSPDEASVHDLTTSTRSVPISKLPQLVKETSEDAIRRGLLACHFGHVVSQGVFALEMVRKLNYNLAGRRECPQSVCLSERRGTRGDQGSCREWTGYLRVMKQFPQDPCCVSTSWWNGLSHWMEPRLENMVQG
jgi:hypothetical protein